MQPHTMLSIKTDKKLKEEAKKLSSELGVPLSTVVNAFLKQFVREREITFSADPYRPTKALERILEEAEREYTAGEYTGPMKGDEMLSHLKAL